MKNKKIGSILTFFIGIMFGMTIWGASVWADFEASLFSLSIPIEEQLKSLSCPTIISRSEIGKISAYFKNNKDSRWKTKVRAFISDGYISWMSENEAQLELSPGESETLEWQVSSNNAVWGRVVMARVYTLRNFPFPSLTNTCGILVIDVFGIPGTVLVIIWLSISFLLTAIGLYLWFRESRTRPSQDQNVTTFLLTLAITVTIGLVLGFLGNTLLSLLLGVLTILLIAVGIGFMIQSSEKTKNQG